MKILKCIVEFLVMLLAIIALVICLLLECVPLKITRRLSSYIMYLMSRLFDWVSGIFDKEFKVKKSIAYIEYMIDELDLPNSYFDKPLIEMDTDKRLNAIYTLEKMIDESRR